MRYTVKNQPYYNFQPMRALEVAAELKILMYFHQLQYQECSHKQMTVCIDQGAIADSC